MIPSLFGFRYFIEAQTRSLKKKDKARGEKENYLDGMWRELGIEPNLIPDIIESGPIEFDGIYYNQALWRVIKPIDLKDMYVQVQFHKSLSPDINQRAYRRLPDGKMQPFPGDPDTSRHLITIDQLAKLLGRDWGAMSQQSPPMMT